MCDCSKKTHATISFTMLIISRAKESWQFGVPPKLNFSLLTKCKPTLTHVLQGILYPGVSDTLENVQPWKTGVLL